MTKISWILILALIVFMFITDLYLTQEVITTRLNELMTILVIEYASTNTTHLALMVRNVGFGNITIAGVLITDTNYQQYIPLKAKTPKELPTLKYREDHLFTVKLPPIPKQLHIIKAHIVDVNGVKLATTTVNLH